MSQEEIVFQVLFLGIAVLLGVHLGMSMALSALRKGIQADPKKFAQEAVKFASRENGSC